MTAELFWRCQTPGCDAAGTTTGTESGQDARHVKQTGHSTVSSLRPWASEETT